MARTIVLEKSDDMDTAMLVRVFDVAYKGAKYLDDIDIQSVMNLSRFCFKYDAPTVLDLCEQKLRDFADCYLGELYTSTKADDARHLTMRLLLVAEGCKLEALFDTIFNHDSFEFLLTQHDFITQLADGLQDAEHLQKLAALIEGSLRDDPAAAACLPTPADRTLTVTTSTASYIKMMSLYRKTAKKYVILPFVAFYLLRTFLHACIIN